MELLRGAGGHHRQFINGESEAQGGLLRSLTPLAANWYQSPASWLPPMAGGQASLLPPPRAFSSAPLVATRVKARLTGQVGVLSSAGTTGGLWRKDVDFGVGQPSFEPALPLACE